MPKLVSAIAVLLLPLILAACQVQPLYEPIDLIQAHQAYSEIYPAYWDFKRAYYADNTLGLLVAYSRIEHACKLVDVIDERDSIDPNVKLFAASSWLDNYCNYVEVIHAIWAKAHHQPYDKKFLPDIAEWTFAGAEKGFLLMPEFFKDPSGYA